MPKTDDKIRLEMDAKSKRERAEYLQREMDDYGVDTLDELRECWEVDTIAQDQIDIDGITEEIEAGARPNKKDIAYLLRLHPRTEIPQVMREYIAKMLLGELKSQRNSRLRPDGMGLMEFSSNYESNHEFEIQSDFGCGPVYNALKSAGMNKEKAFEIIAKARLLKTNQNIYNIQFIDDETEKDNYIKQLLDSIETAYTEIDDDRADEFDDNLSKEIEKISRLIYPRKR